MGRGTKVGTYEGQWEERWSVRVKVVEVLMAES